MRRWRRRILLPALGLGELPRRHLLAPSRAWLGVWLVQLPGSGACSAGGIDLAREPPRLPCPAARRCNRSILLAR